MVFAPLLAAVALVPMGFSENVKLDAKAAAITAKPTHVYCATTYQAWTDYVSTLSEPPPDGGASGFTPAIGTAETYLSPTICQPLLSRLKGHLPFPRQFGGALDVFAHESEHMSGIADEGQTECSAYRSLPHYLVTVWGFKTGGPAYRQALYGAALLHKQLPPQYRTVC